VVRAHRKTQLISPATPPAGSADGDLPQAGFAERAAQAPQVYELYKQAVTTDIAMLDVVKWLRWALKVTETGNIRQYFLTYNHVYD